MVELMHLRHQVKYYQDTTHANMFIKVEFKEAYNQFKLEREAFMDQIVSYQEETLLGIIAHKDEVVQKLTQIFGTYRIYNRNT
jgi:hypothetical protein